MSISKKQLVIWGAKTSITQVLVEKIYSKRSGLGILFFATTSF